MQTRSAISILTARQVVVIACLSGVLSMTSPVHAEGVEPANPESVTDLNAAAVAPAKLIERMAVALHTLNYEGIFVHAQGTNLNTLHIVHASNADGEFERLIALDGEAREVIRNNSLVTCIWPGTQSVVVSQIKPRDVLPRVDASLATNLRYEFSYEKPDRVAGKATHVVNVIPRDKYRYGYRFWIDKDNAMLLRSKLLDGPNNPVEQVIFTQIEYPDTVDTGRFDVLKRGRGKEVVSWLEPKNKAAASNLEARHSEQADRVGFSSLPEGYGKVSETYSPAHAREASMSHVMLSDGMASVSVYIEYLPATDHVEATLGLSRMGAMNAFGVSTESALITAVGEVPEATVKAIAAAVTLAQ